MECFGNDRTKAKTQTVFCNSIYEDTKPLRMYYQEIEETNIQFEIPKIPEEFRKLWQEELEIIEKLHKLEVLVVDTRHFVYIYCLIEHLF